MEAVVLLPLDRAVEKLEPVESPGVKGVPAGVAAGAAATVAVIGAGVPTAAAGIGAPAAIEAPGSVPGGAAVLASVPLLMASARFFTASSIPCKCWMVDVC